MLLKTFKKVKNYKPFYSSSFDSNSSFFGLNLNRNLNKTISTSFKRFLSGNSILKKDFIDDKNELIRWINEKHSKKERFNSTIKIVNENDWDVLCEFDKDDWILLVGLPDVGISIYNKIQALKTLTKGNSIK